MATQNKDTADGQRDATVDAAVSSYVPAVAANWTDGDPGSTADALDQTALFLKNIKDFFNGTFVETFDALVTSDGATITMSLEQTGGGDLTMKFSDGYTTFDCTPAATIVLPEGTDTVPILNHVFILQSDKILTVATNWPTAEHIKVGKFITPSASLVASGAGGNNFLYGNQNLNDHRMDTENLGHLAHVVESLRHQGAKWHTGCEGVATQDGNDLWVSIAVGDVSQLHHHVFAALNSDTVGAGDPILVVNDPDANFAIIHSLNEITKLADGTSIGTNKYVQFILAGVISKSGEVSPMMLNLPSGQYISAATAATDLNRFANVSFPQLFVTESTMLFLIAGFVCKHTATAMEIQSTIDLRGKAADTSAGGGSGTGDVSALAVLTDNAIVRGDGGAKGVQGSGILIDDSDNMTGGATLTQSVAVVSPKLQNAGDIHINAAVSGVTKTVFVENTGVAGNANLDVENNIIVGGTVDGRDIAADGAVLDGAAHEVHYTLLAAGAGISF